ncbi:hypothetical protein ILYODFUR_027391 [Ilyodon furcidens]|uniref:Immunoglobulin domain-containing protein n=1 Tax=Ilyodon furcidens TaxID=33524 RepID=A0ABV0UNI2_9TELE
MILTTLFCFFFVFVQITNSKTNVKPYHGVLGGNIKVRCSLSGAWKIFCRQNCEEENVLIKTPKETDESGRYRIESVKGNDRVFDVSMSNLTQTDSGWYRCGLTSPYQNFLLVAEAVLDGNKDHHFYKEPGSSLTVVCCFGSSGRTKTFCRGGCREEEVLVQTDGDRAQRGRYSIEYDAGGVLYVTITQLTQSDSGWYQCKMDVKFWLDSYIDFIVSVTDAVDQSTATTTTTTTTTTMPSFSSSSASFTHGTSRQSFSSSSASHTPSGSSLITDYSAVIREKQVSSEVLLYVGLSLAFIILLTAGLLVFHRNRSEKHDEDPLRKTKKIPTTEAEVSEDEKKSRPVEISTEYSLISYCKLGVEADGIYSLVTAGPPQNTAEDDVKELTYAQVSFCNSSSDSPLRSSVFMDLVYSEPRVADGC